MLNPVGCKELVAAGVVVATIVTSLILWTPPRTQTPHVDLGLWGCKEPNLGLQTPRQVALFFNNGPIQHQGQLFVPTKRLWQRAEARQNASSLVPNCGV